MTPHHQVENARVSFHSTPLRLIQKSDEQCASWAVQYDVPGSPTAKKTRTWCQNINDGAVEDRKLISRPIAAIVTTEATTPRTGDITGHALKLPRKRTAKSSQLESVICWILLTGNLDHGIPSWLSLKDQIQSFSFLAAEDKTRKSHIWAWNQQQKKQSSWTPTSAPATKTLMEFSDDTEPTAVQSVVHTLER